MAESRIPTWLRTLLPWLLTACLLAIVFLKVDIGETFSHLKKANLYLFLPSVLFFNFYAFFINTLIYTKLFNWFCGPIRYRSVLSIRGASYLLTSINPGAGQGGLFLWVSRKEHLPLREVVSAAMLVPIVDLTFISIALAIPLVLHFLGESLLPEAHVHILVWAEIILCGVVFAYFIFWMGGLWRRTGRRFLETAWLKALREAGLRHYIALLGLRCLQHAPSITAYYLALRAFKGILPFTVFIVRFFPAIIIQYMPITIAQLGTSQGGWSLMYGDLVDINILVAFTLSWNLVYFLCRIALGTFFFRGEARDYFRGDWRTGKDQKKT